MLAYVFRHWPRPETDLAAYEQALRDFHARLAEAGLEGFEGSRSARYAEGGCADWYLLAGSHALDPLNEAAVSGARRAAHDLAAAGAERSHGSLYRLAGGSPDLDAGVEVRFAKPAGMAYAELHARLEEVTRAGGTSLWRRQMVLGPPPEFCLLAPGPIGLPAEFEAQVLERSIVE